MGFWGHGGPRAGNGVGYGTTQTLEHTSPNGTGQITTPHFHCQLRKVLKLSLDATLDVGNSHVESLLDIANSTFTNSIVGNVILHQIGHMVMDGGRKVKEAFDEERDSLFNEITIVAVIIAVAAIFIVIAMVLFRDSSIAALKDRFSNNRTASPTAPARTEVITSEPEKPLELPPHYHTLPNGTVIETSEL